MRTLVIAERNESGLRPASLSSLSFARMVAEQTGGELSWLVLGCDIDALATEAARFAPVLAVDSPKLEHPLHGPYAQLIARVVREQQIELVVAAASSFSKDVVTRAAGLLGGAMASDVLRHELVDGRLQFDCPRYAGAVTTTLRLIGSPQIVTVRPSSYPSATPLESASSVARLTVDDTALDCRVECAGVTSRKSSRPDVTEARIVVSGGRAIQNSDDFETLVGGLADALEGATGSSRALVDAGIAPNEFQVGQTGKVVAPDYYIALGLSGAVQHLAGMKNSRTIIAINKDPDAPIFEVADYGLVGDIYEVVPEFIQKLKSHASTATC